MGGKRIVIGIGDERCCGLSKGRDAGGRCEIAEGGSQKLGRAEGAGKTHAPTTRQAERCKNRLEDRLIAKRDGQVVPRQA